MKSTEPPPSTPPRQKRQIRGVTFGPPYSSVLRQTLVQLCVRAKIRSVVWNEEKMANSYYVDRLDDHRDGPGQKFVALEEQLIEIDQPEHKSCEFVQLDGRMLEEADTKKESSRRLFASLSLV
jgi:hypothetical protein